MRLLQRREHSARELTQKLRARGLESESANEVVGTLGESGWQSDGRYAEMLIRSRASQGYGRLRIEGEMRVAGIADSEIRQAFEESEVDWDGVLQQLWARKFGEPAEDAAERNKQYRYLLARGFEGRQISKVMKGEFEDE